MVIKGITQTLRRRHWFLVPALAALVALAAACAPAVIARLDPQPTRTAAPTGQSIPEAEPTPTVEPAATEQIPPTVEPLTGELTRAELEAHPGWENLRAQDYTPDPEAVAAIREKSEAVDVFVFLGTWCSDSEREVPRFLKIMDQAGLSESRVTLLGLDRSKKDAEGLATAFDVKYVPTFIIFRQGREIGRIVERPAGTLEGDLAQILSRAENPGIGGLFGGFSCH